MRPESVSERWQALRFQPVSEQLAGFGFRDGLALATASGAALKRLEKHGDYQRWRALLDQLPRFRAELTELDAPTIVVGHPAQCDREGLAHLQHTLHSLSPWRKGPFRVFGVQIDAEWRSDLKWARLQSAASSLCDRRVLDVGSGNGYYSLRALGAGAREVLGIDPSLLFVMQFEALKRLLPPLPLGLLPLSFEELPQHPTGFDTVLSMGILYHRRDPHEHLERLHAALAPGGELVLETLVLDSLAPELLSPQGRYANMRNVWNIPSLATLSQWLTSAGFCDVRTADVTRTTPREQRATRWMTFHSLEQALDPNDSSRTVEGHPAPTRGMLIASRRD